MSAHRRYEAAPYPAAHGDIVRALAFSPDGTSLATGCDGGVVRIWSVARAELSESFDGRAGDSGVTRIAWTERGFLVTAWNTRRFQGPMFHGTEVVPDPAGPDEDERFRRSGPDDTVVRASGGELITSDAATGAVRSRIPLPQPLCEGTDGDLAVGDDGTVVLALDGHPDATVWIRRPGRPWGALDLPPTRMVHAVALAPDSRTLAVSTSERRVLLFDLATGDVLRELPRTVPGVAVLPDGNRRARVLYEDGAVATWDLRDRVLLGTSRISAGSDEMVTLVDDPDGPRVLTRSPEGAPCAVRVWEVATGALLRELALEGTWRQPRISVDWPIVGLTGLAKWRDEGAVAAWDARTGEHLFTSGVLRPTWRHLVVHRSGLGAVGRREFVGVFDLGTGEARGPGWKVGYDDHPLAFSPDGREIVLSNDGFALSFLAWEDRTGRSVSLSRPGPHVPAWSPVGGRLACVRRIDRALSFWYDGDPIARDLEGHRGTPRAVAFTPDGRRLVSTGEDGQVLLWSAATGRRLATLPPLPARVAPPFG